MHRYQTRYAAATATILTLRLNRQSYGVGQPAFAEKYPGLSLDRNGAHRSHAGSEVGRTREKRHLPTILAPVMTTPLVRRSPRQRVARLRISECPAKRRSATDIKTRVNPILGMHNGTFTGW
jgi:hypothetical protein